MAKVKKQMVEAALLKFLTKVTQTMPSTTYKFLLGSASAFAALKNVTILDGFLAQLSDAQGLIETDDIKKIVDSGFDAADGKIQIELFNSKTSLLSLLVKPLTLTINKQDVYDMIRELEETGIQNVSLQPQQ